MARPTDYASALVDEILERLAEGESLRQICQSEHMPHRATVFRWLAKHADFRDAYTIAREAQADAFLDDIIAIADTPVEAEIVTEKQIGVGRGEHMRLEDVTEIRRCDAVERSKLRVDARKWAAAKLAPKKYGDKLELSGNVRHEDALDELERLEQEAARAGAAGAAEE